MAEPEVATRKRWWWALGQCGQRGAQPGPAPGTKRLPGSGESALPPHREGGTDPARPGSQGSDARQLASGCGRGSGCPGQGVQSLPARRGGTRFPGQRLTHQPAGPCWSAVYSAASTPPPAPGQAPALLPPPPQPWPGAQLGPGGQSYCKRPGRPEAWTLPAGRSLRHLPLPGSASQGRALRPPSS